MYNANVIKNICNMYMYISIITLYVHVHMCMHKVSLKYPVWVDENMQMGMNPHHYLDWILLFYIKYKLCRCLFKTSENC